MAAKIQVNLWKQLTGHQQSIYALDVEENGTIFTAGGDGMAVQWQWQDAADGKLFAKIPEPIYCLKFNPQIGLLCGTQSGDLYMAKDSKNVRNLRKHGGGIFSIVNVSDHIFLTCGGDGKIVLWDSLGNVILERDLSSKSIRHAIPIANGWAFGSSDGNIYIADKNFNSVGTISGHKNSVFALSYFNTLNMLFSGGRDAVILCWDMASGNIAKSVKAHLLHVNDLKLSPDESLLASVSMDKSLKIWNPETMELLKVADAAKYGVHKSSVNRLQWIDNSKLVTVSDDRVVAIWEIYQ